MSRPSLPARAVDSYKGDYGNALLIGGSRGMAGAIALAGMSATRSGAGLVRIALPDCCLDTVAGFSPCYMLMPLPHDTRGRVTKVTDELVHWLANSDCVAIGPGLGRSDRVVEFVVDVLDVVSKQNSGCPVVIDADGLVALSQIPGWRKNLFGPVVLTPHAGEWARLSRVPASDPEAQSQAAVQFALENDCIIALKGHRTQITDGSRNVRNETGTPAMAIGGSGDVLTGIITALICQKLTPFDATQMAVHVHGRAGQIAEKTIGSHVVLPTELIDSLPAAFVAK